MLHKVRAGDIELAVYDTGQGEPVVLAHGFPLDHTMWEAQINLLAQSHRVLAFDLRGFGRSDVVAGTATMPQMADDLAAALDSLGINQPVTFGGLSMGGYVAWQFWLRHPQRLARLLILDSRSTADTPEAAQGRHQLAARIESEGPRAAWEAMRDKLFAAQTIQGHPEVVERIRQVAQHSAPQGLAAALRGMALRPDVTPQLPGLRVPTLVLAGEHDAISPPDEMRGFAQQIPHAQFVLIPAAGHMSPVENPAAVNQALADFL
jgi:pimeloyl-ACP methyl ester carboxylesterase